MQRRKSAVQHGAGWRERTEVQSIPDTPASSLAPPSASTNIKTNQQAANSAWKTKFMSVTRCRGGVGFQYGVVSRD